MPRSIDRVIGSCLPLKSKGAKNAKVLAFSLYKYFPFGGLQRDFVRIALACQQCGYAIRVYVHSWQGAIPKGFEVVMLPKNGWSSQAKYKNFSRDLAQHLIKYPVLRLIGFNKMPDLDVYYAADGCYEQRVTDLYRGLAGWFYRLGRRYQYFSSCEKSVFGLASKTQVLMISKPQQLLFERIYKTPKARLHQLPPGISRDRCAAENAAQIRAEFRSAFKLESNELIILMVGSGFKTKGVDRSLKALANLPVELRNRTRLFILGQDNPAVFQRQSQQLAIASRVTFFSGRDDVPRFLLGADLLVHPARHENTGTVLLEAVVAGLPVLCSAVCGYAEYVEIAKAGVVLTTGEFQQTEFDKKLMEILASHSQRSLFSEQGLAYSKSADLYSMPECAADFIDAQARRCSKT